MSLYYLASGNTAAAADINQLLDAILGNRSDQALGFGSDLSGFGRSISHAPLGTVGLPTLAIVGGAGTTTWAYQVVATNVNGDALPSSIATTTTGPATLTGTNYVTITWTQVLGASSYKIVRTTAGGTPATTGLIQTVTATQPNQGASAPTMSFNDTGLAASAYTAVSNAAGGTVSQGLAGLIMPPIGPLTAAVASVSFQSIPQTQRSLSLLWYARGDTAAANIDLRVRFNNDTTANYDHVLITQSSATAEALSEGLGVTSMQLAFMPAASATASYFGQGRAEIVNYIGTTGQKMLTSLGGWSESNLTNAGARTWQGQAKWRTVATAINRIDIFPGTGNFVAGSWFALLGSPA